METNVKQSELGYFCSVSDHVDPHGGSLKILCFTS